MTFHQRGERNQTLGASGLTTVLAGTLLGASLLSGCNTPLGSAALIGMATYEAGQQQRIGMENSARMNATHYTSNDPVQPELPKPRWTGKPLYEYPALGFAEGGEARLRGQPGDFSIYPEGVQIISEKDPRYMIAFSYSNIEDVRSNQGSWLAGRTDLWLRFAPNRQWYNVTFGFRTDVKDIENKIRSRMRN